MLLHKLWSAAGLPCIERNNGRRLTLWHNYNFAIIVRNGWRIIFHEESKCRALYSLQCSKFSMLRPTPCAEQSILLHACYPFFPVYVVHLYPLHGTFERKVFRPRLSHEWNYLRYNSCIIWQVPCIMHTKYTYFSHSQFLKYTLIIFVYILPRAFIWFKLRLFYFY